MLTSLIKQVINYTDFGGINMNTQNKRTIMPCGWQRTGVLKEHIAHYRSCSHPACVERLQVYNNLKSEIAESFKSGKSKIING